MTDCAWKRHDGLNGVYGYDRQHAHFLIYVVKMKPKLKSLKLTL